MLKNHQGLHVPSMFNRISFVIIMTLWVCLGVFAILHGQYAGQDFTRHQDNIRHAAIDPIGTLTMPVTQGHVTPTLYHVINGVIYRLIPEPAVWTIIASLNLCANIIGLILFYLILSLLIDNALLKIAAFSFIAFLPTTLTTSTVIASDAYILPLTALLCYSLIRNKYPLLVAVLLVCIFLLRFNYGWFIAAVILLGVLKNHRAWVLAGCCGLLIAVGCMVGFARHQTPSLTQEAHQGQMPLTHLLLPNLNDLTLLGAPSFNQINMASDYSYLGLLHLGLFSDIMNIYQPITTSPVNSPINDEYDKRRRSPNHQHLMHLSLISGLIFFYGLLLTVVISLLQWFKLNTNIQLITLLALPVWLITAGVLPFKDWAYVQGVWLPRHIIGALMLLFIVMFYQINRLIRNNTAIAMAVFMLTIYQCFIHILFMFPLSPKTF